MPFGSPTASLYGAGPEGQLLVVNAGSGISKAWNGFSTNSISATQLLTAYHAYRTAEGSFLATATAYTSSVQPAAQTVQRLCLYRLAPPSTSGQPGMNAEDIESSDVNLVWCKEITYSGALNTLAAPVYTCNKVASSTSPSCVTVMRLDTQEEIAQLSVDAGCVLDLAWSPSGR